MSIKKSNTTFFILVTWGGFFFFSNIFSACKDKTISPNFDTSYPVDTSIFVLNTLPYSIRESSGLACFDNSIWTHNDSGDDPVVYCLDINNQSLIRQTTLLGIQNIDWEEFAQDSQYLYIGDFGNNVGNRQDLVIYKLPKTELKKDTTSNFEQIEFQYPDQTNFNNTAYQHNFDCEAMIALDDLYLFSKNHQNYQSRLYRLSKIAGNYTPELLDTFNAKGTITAASIDKKENVLVLSGYKYDTQNSSYNPFLWIFWDYPENQFFKGKSQRVNFPFDKQIEGISFLGEGIFIISSESEHLGLGALYLFDSKKWTD